LNVLEIRLRNSSKIPTMGISRWHEPKYADAGTKGYHKLLSEGWEPYAVTHRVEEISAQTFHPVLNPRPQTQEITYIMHWFRKKMTEDEAQQAFEKEEEVTL
jgi:hypothetical protein